MPEARIDDGATSLAAELALPEPHAAALPAAIKVESLDLDRPRPADVPAADRPIVAGPATPASPVSHPLAALRRLRIEAELVEPIHRSWRRVLVNFAIAYVVVIGSILGLIAAFLVLTGGAGSGHP